MQHQCQLFFQAQNIHMFFRVQTNRMNLCTFHLRHLIRMISFQHIAVRTDELLINHRFNCLCILKFQSTLILSSFQFLKQLQSVMVTSTLNSASRRGKEPTILSPCKRLALGTVKITRMLMRTLLSEISMERKCRTSHLNKLQPSECLSPLISLKS